MRFAINGFGRIGRSVLRSALCKEGFFERHQLVAINDSGDVRTNAHLLKYDSIHGVLDAKVEVKGDSISVNGMDLPFYHEKEAGMLPWQKLDIDAVHDCTGKYTEREKAQEHIKAGAKKVIVSAPMKGADVTLVLGVNESAYDPKKHAIISMASCTTNCLAPVAKVLNDSFGIGRGFMSTVHAYTNDQRTLDGTHKDLRRARAAAVSIIPTTTGAAKAIGEVIPALKGKLDGIALRVPVSDGSANDLTVELEKEATRDDVNKAMKRAADGQLKGILEYTEEPIVSCDVIGNPHSAILDALSTKTLGSMCKTLAWYDNEWGYSCRMVDMLDFLEKKK